MVIELLLDEVEELQRVSVRLEQIATEHPVVTTELFAVANSVRNSATLLAVLVATKIDHGHGHK